MNYLIPPIPSRFYYTPWACKEQLGGERGGRWGVRKDSERWLRSEMKRLIDRDKMTAWRYTGQTKAGISNHNLQYQKDMCVIYYWKKKKDHSEPLSTEFS